MFRFPNTSMEEFNLDWIIKRIKEITKEMSDFKVVNQIVWGGLHDPGKEYPRFCIVDTPTHEGYISIQPVPAGITIDNEDYWRQVANYSALYADFQNRIVALETEVADLSTRIRNIDGVANRKFLFFGDSYGETYESGGNTIVGWLDNIVSLMGLSASQYAGSQALSGYGFLSNGNKWIDLITPMADDTDVTDVVFVGGHNDDAYVVDNPALVTYIENTIDTCKTKFPNAKIWVGFCSIETDYNTKTKKCYKIYSDVASRKGCAFLNGLEYVLFNSTYILNHAHPNNDGTMAMASALYSMLMGGGYYNGVEPTVITYDANPNVETDSHDNLVYTIENDHIIIEGVPSTPESFAISFGSGKAITSNGVSAFVFDKPNNLPLMPKARTIRLGSATGTCVYSGTPTVSYNCTLELTMYNGYMLGYLRALDASGAYIVPTAANLLTSIVLTTPKFVCDLLR